MRFINITNRPGTSSESGIVAILRTALSPNDLWVSPESPKKFTSPELQIHWRKADHLKANVGVFPYNPKHRRNHYDHISLGLMWPLMHENQDQVDAALEQMQFNSDGKRVYNDPQTALEKRGESYRRFIARTTRALNELDCSDSICLAHDMTCVGAMAVGAIANVLTVHTPFPSLEFLRGVKIGNSSILETDFLKQYLRDLAKYDLVTMHTDKDQNNLFDTIEACLPEAHINRRDHSVTINRKTSRIEKVHVGIDPDFILEEARTAKISNDNKRTFWDPIQGRQAILSVSRNDYTKGTLEIADAIDLFFSENPKLVDTTTFVIIRQPSRIGLKKQEAYQEKVAEKFAKLKEKYGPAVLFTDQGMPHDQLMKFMQAPELKAIMALPTTHDGHDLTLREFVDINPFGAPKAVLATRGVGAMSVLGAKGKELQDDGGAFKVQNAQSYDEIVVALTKIFAGNDADLIQRFDTMKRLSAQATGQNYLDTIRALVTQPKGVLRTQQIAHKRG